MKLLLILVFAAGGFLMGAQSMETKTEIKISPLEDGTGTAFVVTASALAGADHAIVTVCYWTDFPGVVSKILRCRDTVIPAIENIGVLSDPVPVPLSEIASVSVRLVREIFIQRFPFKATPQ